MLFATEGLSKEQLGLFNSQRSTCSLANQGGQQHCRDDGPAGPRALPNLTMLRKIYQGHAAVPFVNPQKDSQAKTSHYFCLCDLRVLLCSHAMTLTFLFYLEEIIFQKILFLMSKSGKNVGKHKTMIHNHSDLNH